MKQLSCTVASIALIASACAHASSPTPSPDDIRRVAPALAHYQERLLDGDLWKRPGLSPRDRSLVTVAALIARNQTIELPHQLELALDNGVRPSELSEVITHLAFYSGWGNAMSAVAIATDVFGKRGVGADQLPPAKGELLPLDEVAGSRARRASRTTSARSLPAWCSSRATSCSTTCGSARLSPHGTGAS
jgi:4-carboxymuconolactone decarboxylase